MNQLQIHRRIRASIVCATLLAAPAAAQNMVTNGDFATDISSWSLSGPGIFTFDAGPVFDADSNPASGSGRVQNQSSSPSGSAFAGQCINDVDGGTNYDFGGKIYFDSTTQTDNGRAHIAAIFFDGTNCIGSTVGGFSTGSVFASTTDIWLAAEAFASLHRSPPGVAKSGCLPRRSTARLQVRSTSISTTSSLQPPPSVREPCPTAASEPTHR